MIKIIHWAIMDNRLAYYIWYGIIEYMTTKTKKSIFADKMWSFTPQFWFFFLKKMNNQNDLVGNRWVILSKCFNVFSNFEGTILHRLNEALN